MNIQDPNYTPSLAPTPTGKGNQPNPAPTQPTDTGPMANTRPGTDDHFQENQTQPTARGRSQTHVDLSGGPDQAWTPADCKQAVQSLNAAMQGLGTSEWNVLRILKNLSPEQRGEVEMVFNRAYAHDWGNLRQALESELSGSELIEVQSLLDSAKGPEVNHWKAVALNDAMQGSGTDEERVYRILENTSFADLRQVAAEFKQNFGPYWGGGLRTALYDDFSEDELARAVRLLDLAELSAHQDRASETQITQAVTELHQAMKGSGTDEDALFRVLETFSAQDLKRIDQNFTQRFGEYWGGSLETALRDDLSGSDLERALRPLKAAEAATPSDASTVTRARLDFVLKEGNDRSVRHQIGAPELELATIPEKITLIQKLLDGSTGDEDEMALLRILKHGSESQRSELLTALGQQNRLAAVLDNVQGSEYELLLDELPQSVHSATAAAAIFRACADQSDDRHKLLLHRVLDQARREGFFKEAVTQIQARNSMQQEVLQEARNLSQRRAPAIVIAHRGGSPSGPENTLATLDASLRHSIQALEIDISMTRDGKLMLWHDQDPNGLVAQIRQAGWEPNTLYPPNVPHSQERKPVSQLSEQSLRQHYGYQGQSSRPQQSPIPELKDALELLQNHPKLETVYLDTKIPEDEPEFQTRYAQALKTLIENAEAQTPNLRQHLVILNTNLKTLDRLKAVMPPEAGFQYGYDREDLNRFGWLGLRGSEDVDFTSNSAGNTYVSAGNPRSPVGQGYDDYLAAMQRARTKIDRSGSGQKLVAWSLNDPLKIRELLAIGVDEVMTDDPEGLQRQLQEMGLK